MNLGNQRTAGANDHAMSKRISTGSLPIATDGGVVVRSTPTGDRFLAGRCGLAGDRDFVAGRAGFVAPAVSLPDRVVTIDASGGGMGESTGCL